MHGGIYCVSLRGLILTFLTVHVFEVEDKIAKKCTLFSYYNEYYHVTCMLHVPCIVHLLEFPLRRNLRKISYIDSNTKTKFVFTNHMVMFWLFAWKHALCILVWRNIYMFDDARVPIGRTIREERYFLFLSCNNRNLANSYG